MEPPGDVADLLLMMMNMMIMMMVMMMMMMMMMMMRNQPRTRAFSTCFFPTLLAVNSSLI